MFVAATISLPFTLGAVSFVISVGGLLYSRRSTRSGERSEARAEAVELADVRGKFIRDLEERLEKIEHEQQREREAHAHEIDLHKKVLDHVRQDAAEAQRLLTVGFRGTLLRLLSQLEHDPPDTDGAIDYLREMLNGEAPQPPTHFRRRRAA